MLDSRKGGVGSGRTTLEVHRLVSLSSEASHPGDWRAGRSDFRAERRTAPKGRRSVMKPSKDGRDVRFLVVPQHCPVPIGRSPGAIAAVQRRASGSAVGRRPGALRASVPSSGWSRAAVRPYADRGRFSGWQFQGVSGALAALPSLLLPRGRGMATRTSDGLLRGISRSSVSGCAPRCPRSSSPPSRTGREAAIAQRPGHRAPTRSSGSVAGPALPRPT